MRFVTMSAFEDGCRKANNDVERTDYSGTDPVGKLCKQIDVAKQGIKAEWRDGVLKHPKMPAQSTTMYLQLLSHGSMGECVTSPNLYSPA